MPIKFGMILLKPTTLFLILFLTLQLSFAKTIKSEKAYELFLNEWYFITENVKSDSGFVELFSQGRWILYSKSKEKKLTIISSNAAPIRPSDVQLISKATTASKLIGLRELAPHDSIISEGFVRNPFRNEVKNIKSLQLGPTQEFVKILAQSALLKAGVITPKEFLSNSKTLPEAEPYINSIKTRNTTEEYLEIRIPVEFEIDLEGTIFKLSGSFHIGRSVRSPRIEYINTNPAQNDPSLIRKNYNKLCNIKTKDAFIEKYCEKLDYNSALNLALTKKDYRKLTKVITNPHFTDELELVRETLRATDVQLLLFLLNNTKITTSKNFKDILWEVRSQIKHVNSALRNSSQLQAYLKKELDKEPKDTQNLWCTYNIPQAGASIANEIPKDWKKIDLNDLTFYLPPDLNEIPNTGAGLSPLFEAAYGMKFGFFYGENERMLSAELAKEAKEYKVEGHSVSIGTFAMAPDSFLSGIFIKNSLQKKANKNILGLIISGRNPCIKNLIFQISKTIKLKEAQSPQILSRSQIKSGFKKYKSPNCCSFHLPVSLTKTYEQKGKRDDIPHGANSFHIRFNNQIKKTSLDFVFDIYFFRVLGGQIGLLVVISHLSQRK